MKSTQYFYSPWIQLIYFSWSKYISVTSFVQNTRLKTCLNSEMSDLRLILFWRGSASASFTLKVLPATPVSHYIGIWLKKTPKDVQVKFLIHNNSLHRSFLIIFSTSVTTPTKKLFNQFSLSEIFYKCFDVFPPHLAELLSFSKPQQGIYILFPYVLWCSGRQLLDKWFLLSCFYNPFFLT